MKKLDTSQIAPGVGFPVKKGTLDFLQLSYGEIISELVQELYPTASIETQVTAVRGCGQTPSGSNTILSAGAIYVAGSLLNPLQPNGELFLLPTPQTAATAEAILTIGTSYYTGDGTDADPVVFSNNNTYNVHDIRTLVLTNGPNTTPGYVCDLADLQYVQPPFAYRSNLFTNGMNIAHGTSTGVYSSGATPLFTIADGFPISSSFMMFSFSCQFNYQVIGNCNFNLVVNGQYIAGTATNPGSTTDAMSISFVGYCPYIAGQSIAVTAMCSNPPDNTAWGLVEQAYFVCQCFDAH